MSSSPVVAGGALVSVYDKSRLDNIVGALGRRKIKIIGSGGTAQAIRKLGVAVVEVSEYTGTPEMPGGLVKTLHPKIHAGILGDWNDPEQRSYLESTGVEPVDYVIVNLYPFQEVVKREPSDLRRAVDNIDIGGVALIRAAAKGAFLNHRVTPVTNPIQYESVAREVSTTGVVSEPLRQRLAREAFAVTASYEAAIRDYLSKWSR